jgi:fructose-1,6-bisphosphatase II
MDRNLGLEFVRVTEAAAIASAEWIGRGDKYAADQAAVDAMRSRFNQIAFRGEVVIGEGSKDEAPELYTGEVVGAAETPRFDLAIDPLEATDSVAHGRTNALCVIVAGAEGSLLHAPDTYMDKLAVSAAGAGAIDLDAPRADNIRNVAKALGKDPREMTIMVLDRERHADLIAEIRSVGAMVRLITDGDVAAAIATCMPASGIDMIMGIGGSTEAVLAAAAVKIMGGAMLCRFRPRNPKDEEALRAMGISDANKIFTAEDLAHGKELSFTATGVIDGPLLKGVRYEGNHVITESLIIRGQSGTVRYLTAYHALPDSQKK